MLYLDDNTPWPTALTALGPDQSYEARKKALEEGPYGKCVFHNDNDVVDHQVASLLFGKRHHRGVHDVRVFRRMRPHRQIYGHQRRDPRFHGQQRH